jgi:DNA-3-methyladenine glycosylase
MRRNTETSLPRSFFLRRTELVARDLLGCLLVRQSNGARLSGRIVEAEAYRGEEDLACHAKAGRTKRTEIMYGPPGFAYVYFTYGMHWMLNVVAEKEGFPAAVLIRAVEPIEGIEVMRRLRGMDEISLLCKGPGRLTQAMAIQKAENGLDLCEKASFLRIEPGVKPKDREIIASPRIGLGKTPEPWLSILWRFHIGGNSFVSK